MRSCMTPVSIIAPPPAAGQQAVVDLQVRRSGQSQHGCLRGYQSTFYYSYKLTYPPFLLPLPAPQVCFPSGNTRQSGQARRPLNFHAGAVAPANGIEGPRLRSDLDAMLKLHPDLKPRYLLADKGYHALYNFRHAVGKGITPEPVP